MEDERQKKYDARKRMFEGTATAKDRALLMTAHEQMKYHLRDTMRDIYGKGWQGDMEDSEVDAQQLNWTKKPVYIDFEDLKRRLS